MEFCELLFDLYFLSARIQDCANDLSGLEFADERGHLGEDDTFRLRETGRRLTRARQLATERLAEIRARHGTGFAAHLDAVEARLTALDADPAGRMREFDRQLLADLKSHLAQVRRDEATKYSVWWGFYYVRKVLGQEREYRFTAADLPAAARQVVVRCPACAGTADLDGALDLFLPPTAAPYDSVTLLDEYRCGHCRQAYQALLRVRFREPRGVEVVDVGFPPVHFAW